jgi:hypothetical protein
MGMFNSDSSGQLSDQIFGGSSMVLVYLKMKFAKPRSSELTPNTLILRSSIFLMSGPSITTFTVSTRSSELIHLYLVDMIENHAIFGSDRQLPCEIQLAIFLNCAGHYGNAATSQDIADWAGISVGSIYNCTNHVMIAIASLHDSAISWNLYDPDYICEKAKAKEWVESRTCGE